METRNHRLTRRAFLGTMGLGMAGTAVLAACAPVATPTSAPKPTDAPKPANTTAPAQSTVAPAQPTAVPAAKPKGVVRCHTRSGAYENAWKKTADLFKEQFPDVKIQIEPTPGGELPQKLLTMAAGGTIGDLFFTNIYTQDYQRYAVTGISREMDEYATRDNIDWSQWYSVCVDMLRFNGHIYGMLLGGQPGRTGLFYHKQIFQEAGVPAPDESWTFDTIMAQSPKLTQGGRLALYPPFRDVPELVIYLRSFGGDAYSPDGKKATLNSEASKKAITWLWEGMHKRNYFTKPSDVGEDYQGYKALWSAGKLAMVAQGIFMMGWAKQSGVDFGLTLLPKGPVARGSMTEVNYVAVAKATKNPDAAWEFAKALSGREAGIFHLEVGATPGARPDVYGDAKVLADNPTMKVWLKSWENAMPFTAPANLRGQEANDVIVQNLGAMWSGSATPDSGVIERANQLAQAVLDKPTVS